MKEKGRRNKIRQILSNTSSDKKLKQRKKRKEMRRKEKQINTFPHLAFGVAENDSLSNGECVVQVTEGVKLPLLSLHRHKELLDAFQCQLITEHQERNGTTIRE